jgi:predicted aspartyl protease
MTVVDREVAEEVGVLRTGRRRALISASGHKLEGEVVVFRELSVEGEVLDYEKALEVELSGEVKEVLRGLGVDEHVIVGLATVELSGFIPDTAAGKLRKVEAFLL